MQGLSSSDRELTLAWELGCAFLEEEIISELTLHPHQVRVKLKESVSLNIPTGKTKCYQLLWPRDGQCLTVSLCSLNPGSARREQGSWKKAWGVAGTADSLNVSWPAQRLQQQTRCIFWSPGDPADAVITQPHGLLWWNLADVYRAKVVPRPSRRLVRRMRCADTNHVFTKRGAAARGCGVREPDIAILANLLFPYIQDPGASREFFIVQPSVV